MGPLLKNLVLELEKYVFLRIIKKCLNFFKSKSTQRKNLKIPESLDFLGFFTYAFLRLSNTYFYGYKTRIFTKEMVTKIRKSIRI